MNKLKIWKLLLGVLESVVPLLSDILVEGIRKKKENLGTPPTPEPPVNTVPSNSEPSL